MGLFSHKKKEPQLPNNLFDRVGSAAFSIANILMKNKLMSKPDGDIDICLWENIGYILAALKQAGTITSPSANSIRRGFADLYEKDPSKKTICSAWIMLSYTFYKRQVEAMIDGEHQLPDVIVYNITHPNMSDRKTLDDLPVSEIDIMKVTSAWSIIADIMGRFFFRRDETVSSLPLFP